MTESDSDGLKAGVYETALDVSQNESLDRIDRSVYQPKTEPLKDDDDRLLVLRADEALKRVLAAIEEKSSGADGQKQSIRTKVAFINRILDVCNEKLRCSEQKPEGIQPVPSLTVPPEKLIEIQKVAEPLFGKGRQAPPTVRPSTGFATSTFFSAIFRNSPHLSEELKREIRSADEIDLLMSFIRWTGLHLLFDELKAFAARGGKLRVITTCYVGATDARAVEELSRLPGCSVRVEYEGQRSRLHAKAWIFKRQSGFSTAYIGSSNVSSAALTDGLEWNIKVTAQDMPDLYARVENSFDQLWPRENFTPYTPGQDREKLVKALEIGSLPGKKPDWSANISCWPQLTPHDYQQRILNLLQQERQKGFAKNLIVAATGTGKTMIAAFDFLRYRAAHPQARLLFIAHRQSILKQALISFRFVLRQVDFGELLTGEDKPWSRGSIFATVQTMRLPANLHCFDPDHFDFVVVDEAHHSSADGYAPLFDYFRPKILLGMTATPERMDGSDIRKYFDGHFAAEIRLPDAIEYNMLSPFHYFVADDNIDLTHARFERGKFDPQELEQLYTSGMSARLRGQKIVEEIRARATDVSSLCAIAFCAGVRHAQYMAGVFSESGLHCATVSSKTPTDVRDRIQHGLQSGKYQIVTVADLYNEGVDIPRVNMVLFLRPTESLTIFLQQLGRGLRLSPETNKTCLTVLDFVGQINNSYDRFEGKFAALLASRTGGLEQQMSHGFPGLPLGCAISLTEKSQKIVLQSIRKSCQNWKKFSVLCKDSHADSLKSLLELIHLTPYQFYSRRKEITFTEIRRAANGQSEPVAEGCALDCWRKGAFRLASVNARNFLSFVQRFIRENFRKEWHCNLFSEIEQKWLWMLYRTVFKPSGRDSLTEAALEKNLKMLLADPEVREEILGLVGLLHERAYVSPGTDSSGVLEIHGRYSRDAIYAAFGKTTHSGIAGVHFFRECLSDVFFVTFNKNEDQFAPSIRYNDFIEGTDLVHWESQNATSPESTTGRRYLAQPREATHVHIFGRAFRTIGANSSPLIYLGEADYKSHKGSQPIAFVWKLRTPLTAGVVRELSDGAFAEDESVLDVNPLDGGGNA